jgi:hypothetical protein
MVILSIPSIPLDLTSRERISVISTLRMGMAAGSGQ